MASWCIYSGDFTRIMNELQKSSESQWSPSSFHVHMNDEALPIDIPVTAFTNGSPQNRNDKGAGQWSSENTSRLAQQLCGFLSKELNGALENHRHQYTSILEAQIATLEGRLVQHMEELMRQVNLGKSAFRRNVEEPVSHDSAVSLDSSRSQTGTLDSVCALLPGTSKALVRSSCDACSMMNTDGNCSNCGVLKTTTDCSSSVQPGGDPKLTNECLSSGKSGQLQFKCRETWQNAAEDVIGPCRQSPANRKSGKSPMLTSQGSVWNYDSIPVLSSQTSKETASARRRWYILHPESTLCLAWDLSGMGFIGYDSITVPMFLSFPISHTPVTVIMFWATLIFWTCDTVINFVKGYVVKEQVELRPSKIIRKYLSSWFVLDICIILSDWVVIALGGNPTGDSGGSLEATRMARVGKTARAVRVLRSLRLLRIAKLKKILQDIQDNIKSEYVKIALTVVKLIMMIILVGHIIACVWYSIGASGGENGWVEEQGFHTLPVHYQYFSSLHWGLSQFTPAGNELKPHNSGERVFATIVLLLGLIISAVLISSITAAMAQLKHLNSATDKQLSLLRRYLRQREVPFGLAMRIRKYSEFLLEEQKKKIQEKDVTLLNSLSVLLQKSLALHLYEPTLSEHIFFRHYAFTDISTFENVCSSALSTILLAKGDILFTAGEAASRMFFVTRGKFLYHYSNMTLWHSQSHPSPLPKPRSKKDEFSQSLRQISARAIGCGEEEVSEQTLRQKDWCCEAVLWMPWTHLGTLSAGTVCETIALSAEKFAAVTSGHNGILIKTSKYAHAFVTKVNGMDRHAITDLTSAQEVFEGHGDIDEQGNFQSLERHRSLLARIKSAIKGLCRKQ